MTELSEQAQSALQLVQCSLLSGWQTPSPQYGTPPPDALVVEPPVELVVEPLVEVDDELEVDPEELADVLLLAHTEGSLWGYPPPPQR